MFHGHVSFQGVVQDMIAMISMELTPKNCFFLLCSETRGRTKKNTSLGKLWSVSHEKKTCPSFPLNPGCLIGILMVVYRNPHVIGQYDPLHLYTLKNKQPGFFHCSKWVPWRWIFLGPK